MSYLEDLFSLEGRTAVVTGAARGNGRAIAEALLRAGARTLLADLPGDELNKTVASLQLEDLPATGQGCDLDDDAQIDELVRHATALSPQVSILVNNAGVTLPGDFLTYPAEAWDRTYRVNLRAPFLLSQKLAPTLAVSGQGIIINITSLNAELAFPGNPAYGAFKGALRQLTKAMALDLAGHGVRVNSIGPGYIRTAMTQGSWNDAQKREDRSRRTMLGRWGEPDDLAGAVIFLASPGSSYITGQDLYVDGGWLAKGL